jgi:hypothetical protein
MTLRVPQSSRSNLPHSSRARSGFLVLTRPGSNVPSVRAHEDLHFQAERAERAFERLREAAA